MLVCIHEDRVEHIPGVKLAILSLLKHCPTLPVLVSFPLAPAAFRVWVDSLSKVKLLDEAHLAGLGWNIKPMLLLRCLEEGYSDVLWMDADIIVNRDFRQRFSTLDDKTLLVAPEYYWGPEQGGNQRAVTWGLKPGRKLPATVNTGIVRATTHHIELLKAWQKLLKHPAYIEAQSQPTEARPLAMVSDQEVLTALLGSEDFSHMPVEFLERGVEIAQCHGAAGYTPVERLNSLFLNSPMFIHAMGGKPWNKALYLAMAEQGDRLCRNRLRTYYDSLHLELSPYVAVACQYREQLGEETDWMNIESIPAKFWSTLFLGHPVLQELPLSLLEASVRRLRRILGGDRNKYQSSIYVESSPLKS
jgi:hypothetical protein